MPTLDMGVAKPAMPLLREVIQERIASVAAMVCSGNEIKNGCDLSLGLLGQFIKQNARMTYTQAFQIADAIMVRTVDILTNDREAFSAMEMIALATYINTCQ